MNKHKLTGTKVTDGTKIGADNFGASKCFKSHNRNSLSSFSFGAGKSKQTHIPLIEKTGFSGTNLFFSF